ncbi:DUF58 domain-containing protein [Thalassoroseus pseudoceratinae]|uniref:DUF58 domain-containing protein n=1 Tax=Thalassoroseus pseudoceratinae TaxID=2713176 RepID=UPI001423250E|nr:DUF58 domain-containing protein [Thalassoroseus pseudoceratinae]
MASSVLSRYLNPDVLSRVADRAIEPRGLVLGNLAGAHKSPLSGFAVEFAGHREYVPGDDPKHVDWRLYFTRDKYFIKQYEQETNFTAHLLIDVSASMRYGDGSQQKMLYAAQLATTLGYSIIRQNDKVSLATFDETLRGFVPPSNSLAQLHRMTNHLDEIEPVETTNIAPALSEFAGRLGRREIVFVFSDFLGDPEDLEAPLQRLRYSRHDVVLFHVMHHHEWEFEFEGMVKFLGLEVEDEFTTQTEDIRRGYLEAVKEHTRKLDEVCQRNRVECVPVDTSRPLAEVLIDYLNHRSRQNRGR